MLYYTNLYTIPHYTSRSPRGSGAGVCAGQGLHSGDPALTQRRYVPVVVNITYVTALSRNE